MNYNVGDIVKIKSAEYIQSRNDIIADEYYKQIVEAGMADWLKEHPEDPLTRIPCMESIYLGNKLVEIEDVYNDISCYKVHGKFGNGSIGSEIINEEIIERLATLEEKVDFIICSVDRKIRNSENELKKIKRQIQEITNWTEGVKTTTESVIEKLNLLKEIRNSGKSL